MEYGYVRGYKGIVEFKSRMQALLRLLKSSLVPLFKLEDKFTKVRMEVAHTTEAYEAVVVREDNAQAFFSCWGEDAVPAILLNIPQCRINFF